MNLTLKFDESPQMPAPGETQLRLDLLDASPLRSFYHITLVRLSDGANDQIQTMEVRSGEFLKDGSKASKQRELLSVIGAAVVASLPAKETEKTPE
jgi:hypothetical protein